jgi:hypothetical protein
MEPGGFNDEVGSGPDLKWRTDALIVILAAVLVAWAIIGWLG